MIRASAIIAIVLCCTFIIQAETVLLKGTVKKAGSDVGIPSVKVSLAKFSDLYALTGADGAFTINGSTSVQLQKQHNAPFQFVLKDDAIVFSQSFQNLTGSVDIFSSIGKIKSSIRFRDLRAGKQSVILPKFDSGINIIRITVNGEVYIHTFVCLGNDLFTKNELQNGTRTGNFTVAKRLTTTAVDTLIAAKDGYSIKKVAIESYAKQNIAIALDSNNGGTPGKCSREVLQAAIDSYIEAQKAGDPSKMLLASQVKYIENFNEVTAEKSICKIALPIALHFSLLDVDSCRTFTEVIVTEGGHPYVIGTRLKVAEGKINEVEAMVTDNGDWGFDAKAYLKYAKDQDWGVIPADKRDTRQVIINAGNAYLDFFADQSKDTVPWGSPCNRLEGGQVYTASSCKDGIPKGSLKIVNRRHVVDVDKGSVDIFCNFGGANGLVDSHMFRLLNGKLRYVHTLTVCPPKGCM